MAELDVLNYKAQANKGMVTGNLSVSSASTGKYIIPYFLSDFLAKYPGIDLLLELTNKTKVIESLKTNETDFALVSTVPENWNIEEESLIENKPYLFGNKSIRDQNKPLIFQNPPFSLNIRRSLRDELKLRTIGRP